MLDYCPALCETAKKRVNSRGWGSFVSVVLGDASDFECKGLPAAGTVDVVTFSYALSMIPDWKAAIRNAFRMLKKGGHIAVCDFTVLDAQWAGMSDLWTWIFSNDHVHLRYTLRRHTCRALHGALPPSLTPTHLFSLRTQERAHPDVACGVRREIPRDGVWDFPVRPDMHEMPVVRLCRREDDRHVPHLNWNDAEVEK